MLYVHCCTDALGQWLSIDLRLEQRRKVEVNELGGRWNVNLIN